MPIDLFPHNRYALDKCYEIWDDGERFACVVHAVGTGKSFIYHKLAEEHPDARILVVSPTFYIFDVQQSAIAKVAPEFDFEHAYTPMTYVGLYLASKDGDVPSGCYDYIVLDEFHRAGARTWQKGVDAVLAANPQAKVLGLSATPVRYCDSGRNMARELFEGNIASTITLPDAWALDLLKKPKYIIGQYRTRKLVDKYEKKLAKGKGRNIEEAKKLLGHLKRSVVSSAANLPDIFADNIKRANGKLIVFCRSRADLNTAMKKSDKWFSKVNSDIHKYKVFVGNKSSQEADQEWYNGSNKKELEAFNADNDSDALKLLFCIDALNEGIHVDGVDGVVMLRNTVSPNIYQQQIGRAMSVAKDADQAVIFDIVGNMEDVDLIYALESEYKKARGVASEGLQDTSDAFEIDDRTVELRELCARLDELFSSYSLDEKVDIVAEYLKNKQHEENKDN